MLNVQQVRFCFIFARALYLHRLFAKALEVCASTALLNTHGIRANV